MRHKNVLKPHTLNFMYQSLDNRIQKTRPPPFDGNSGLIDMTFLVTRMQPHTDPNMKISFRNILKKVML